MSNFETEKLLDPESLKQLPVEQLVTIIIEQQRVIELFGKEP